MVSSEVLSGAVPPGSSYGTRCIDQAEMSLCGHAGARLHRLHAQAGASPHGLCWGSAAPGLGPQGQEVGMRSLLAARNWIWVFCKSYSASELTFPLGSLEMV